MVDVYSSLSSHTRNEAFSHLETQNSWQEIARQNHREDDFEIRNLKVASPGVFSIIIEQLYAKIEHLRRTILHLRHKRKYVHGYFLPAKRHYHPVTH